MRTNHVAKARLAADEVFENGSRPEDVRAALATLGEHRQAFLERLAVRASLHAAGEIEPEEEDAPPASLIAAMLETYEAERTTTGGVDIADPAPWLAAKTFFGNDMRFIMKLAGQQVANPSVRFLRDAADALGVTLDRLKQHFTAVGDLNFVGMERKASGRQTGPQVESFEAAVQSAKLPDDLKKRWLSE